MDKPIFSKESLIYQESFSKDAITIFGHLINKPIRHLEVGIYQAGSALWMLDNILTHKDSRYLGIDDNVRSEVNKNLDKYSYRALVLSGDSNKILPQLDELRIKFDSAYIDGCHYPDWTINDITYTFKMLNNGGIILVDDYAHPDYGLVKIVDDWILKHNRECKVILKNYRIGIQKF